MNNKLGMWRWKKAGQRKVQVCGHWGKHEKLDNVLLLRTGKVNQRVLEKDVMWSDFPFLKDYFVFSMENGLKGKKNFWTPVQYFIAKILL